MLSSSEKKLLKSPDFVFVGDHPALDFANTLVPPPGLGVDFLPNWSQVVDWFQEMKLASKDSLGVAEGRQKESLQAVVDFRARWREEVAVLEAGGEVSEKFLHLLNTLLKGDSYHETICRNHNGTLHLIHSPSQLRGDQLALVTLARQIANFLVESDMTHLRRCANLHSCALYFQDTTKNHRRMWCSVATCGNRHKAAEFRRRQGKAKKRNIPSS